MNRKLSTVSATLYIDQVECLRSRYPTLNSHEFAAVVRDCIDLGLIHLGLTRPELPPSTEPERLVEVTMLDGRIALVLPPLKGDAAWWNRFPFSVEVRWDDSPDGTEAIRVFAVDNNRPSAGARAHELIPQFYPGRCYHIDLSNSSTSHDWTPDGRGEGF